MHNCCCNNKKNLDELFGKPNEGLHSIRIGPFALVDIIFTAAASVKIAPYLGLTTLKCFLSLWGVGALLHWFFGVQTGLFDFLKIDAKNKRS